MQLRKISPWHYFVLLLAIIRPSHETCGESYGEHDDLYGLRVKIYERSFICTDVKNLTQEIKTHVYFGEPVIVVVSESHFEEVCKKFIETDIKMLLLNISNLGIRKIADEAFVDNHIERINLRNNEIIEIGTNAFNSKVIIELDLSHNRLSKLDFLEELSGLRSLNLSFNNMKLINERTFKNLTKLEDLDLSDNFLTYNSKTIFADLINLKSIRLRSCMIDTFFYSMNGLKSLESIDLSGNFLKTLTDQNLPQSLIRLNVGDNLIYNFNLSNLRTLATLDLSNNYLTELNEYLKDMHSVKYLYLQNNKVELSDHIFHQMTKLSIIRLDNNSLDKIDFKLFENNSNLKEIYLSQNSISKVEHLESCPTSIYTINFRKNALCKIGPFSKFSQLDTLDLSDNMLEEINYDLLKNCESLQYLNLSNNNIRVAHIGCFRDLNNLTELDMNFNYLSNISHGAFTGLKNVKSIKLGHNNFETFDEDTFSSVKNLTSLDLSFNEMRSIDVKKILTHAVSLTSINLDGSEWTCAYLAHLITEFKHVEFVEGHTFSDSNIHGIGCINEDISERQSTSDIFNQQIALDMHTSKVVLIILLALLLFYIIFKLLKDYIVQIFYKLKVFEFKTDSWHEFQETN